MSITILTETNIVKIKYYETSSTIMKNKFFFLQSLPFFFFHFFKKYWYLLFLFRIERKKKKLYFLAPLFWYFFYIYYIYFCLIIKLVFDTFLKFIFHIITKKVRSFKRRNINICNENTKLKHCFKCIFVFALSVRIFSIFLSYSLCEIFKNFYFFVFYWILRETFQKNKNNCLKI